MVFEELRSGTVSEFENDVREEYQVLEASLVTDVRTPNESEMRSLFVSSAEFPNDSKHRPSNRNKREQRWAFWRIGDRWRMERRLE